jgi:ABC-type Zn uptake system ZnuABC Zn-binding protein ZnuA
MKTSHFLVLLALCLVSVRRAAAAPEPLRVLTTTTDLADLVRRVGGDAVAVDCLCKGPEDPHFLEARPSFLRLARRAELVVASGMELEIGYLPLLLRECGNPRIRPGGDGYLDASARIRKKGVPDAPVTRAMGDVHASGNPHYLLDPANAVIVAKEIARSLATLRPAGADTFAKHADAFEKTIAGMLLGDDGLLARFRPYRGARIVSYHDDVSYLAERFGLEVVGTLEPKPGVPPTAEHVDSLVTRARAQDVRAVAYRVFQPEGPVRAFCRETGATPVRLAHQPGATEDAPDLVAMYRTNAEKLLAAVSKGAAR